MRAASGKDSGNERLCCCQLGLSTSSCLPSFPLSLSRSLERGDVVVLI
jgi:hypothetical protein